MVTFTLKNIGLIKDTSVSLNDMTIICGKNNTGKTYITYSIYGFLFMWNNLIDFNISEDIIDNLNKDGVARINLETYSSKLDAILEDLSKQYSSMLSDVFSVEEGFFEHSEFTVKVDDTLHDADTSPLDKHFASNIGKDIEIQKEANSNELIVSTLGEKKIDIPLSIIEDRLNKALGQIFFGKHFPHPFIITSERIGITLFYKELDIHRNVLIEQIAKEKKDFRPFELIGKVISRYAMPIRHNINYTRDISDVVKKQESFLFNDDIIKDYYSLLLNGKYKIKDDGMYLVPKKSKSKIPIYFSSSATKSLLQLYFYIQHTAKKGDVLIIDEPELNLHHDNQLIIARLLNYLMYKGISIFITTHSDYIIKEYTNLIRLQKPIQNKEAIMKKYKYHTGECIDHKRIHAYANNNGTLEPCTVDDLGIEIPPFDTVIDELNFKMDDIYFGIDDDEEHDDTR